MLGHLARLRVSLGFVLALAALWLASPTPHSLAIGSLIAIAGEMIRLWAAGHLEKGREVTSSGPYAFTRHPLYLGSTVMGAGLAIASDSVVVSTSGSAIAAGRTATMTARTTAGAAADAALTFARTSNAPESSATETPAPDSRSRGLCWSSAAARIIQGVVTVPAPGAAGAPSNATTARRPSSVDATPRDAAARTARAATSVSAAGSFVVSQAEIAGPRRLQIASSRSPLSATVPCHSPFRHPDTGGS